MSIVTSLVQRKNEYQIEVDAVYKKTRGLKRFVFGKDGRPEPERIHAVDAWSANAEEIAAVSYDIDRMETESQYCPPDERGSARRKQYLDTVSRLKKRLAELHRDRPGIEETMQRLFGRS